MILMQIMTKLFDNVMGNDCNLQSIIVLFQIDVLNFIDVFGILIYD